jgi:hypothetical protein
VLQLPGRHECCVEQLLHLWVSCLSVFENFTNEVYWLLFFSVLASVRSTVMIVLTTASVAET